MTTTPPHPADYARALRAIEDAAELLDRIAAAVPGRWPHLVDALPGQPGAQAYGGDVGGPGSVVVCTRHERDIDECRRADLVGCTGVPVPKRTDPTGQAASTSSRAAADMRDFRRLAKAAAANAEGMVRILERYGPRPANGYERQVTAGGDDGCQSCARVPSAHTPDIAHWSPVWKGVRVDDRIVQCCRWCGDFTRGEGRLPSRPELEAHRDGKRVYRSA